MTTEERRIVRDVIADWKSPDSPEAFAASMDALERALKRSEKTTTNSRSMTPQSDAAQIPALKMMRTPDRIQKPVDDAVAEWRELTAPLESIGFQVHAFDPGVQFRCPESGRLIDMTISAIRKINAGLCKENDEPSHPGEGDQTNA